MEDASAIDTASSCPCREWNSGLAHGTLASTIEGGIAAVRWAAASAASLLAMALAHDPAKAASRELESAWRRCANGDAGTSIAGCTAVIRSAEETRANRAKAFFNRANAYRLQN